VEGSEPEPMHQAMAQALDEIVAEIQSIQRTARAEGAIPKRPRWPMIVLRSPKGWTGPKEVDGKRSEGSWRAHQVPIADVRTREHLKALEQWLRSYRAEELFDASGKLAAELRGLHPEGDRRMSANPHANGGVLLHDLRMPDFRAYSVKVEAPGKGLAEATRVLGGLLRDAMTLNADTRNFRVFGPDETASNRLEALFQ